MLVIADSSPLIVLVEIGHVDVLPAVFSAIIIPPAVERELQSGRRSRLVRDYFMHLPAWLSVRTPEHLLSFARLHTGEQEALSLAIELGADVLLVDERKAYREAVARNLNAIGTVRVLERAAEEGHIDLQDAFDRLKQTDFWISHALLDERLKVHQERKSM